MSWGLLPSATQKLLPVSSRTSALPREEESMLPYGLGRSYGDSCLNDGGSLLLTRGLDRWIRFDTETGVLECEAGVSLAEILRLVVPAGWFLPVSPGTRHVTVGGAIANDVHGKNHHRYGTFAAHVTELNLLRSDGTRRTCSRTENATWFRATVGGLGLTGLITRASLQLRPITSRQIEVEKIRMANLTDFFALADESDSSHEYTVAWVDCLASGSETGRGIFIRGNHDPDPGPLTPDGSARLSVPVHAPGFLLNRWTVKAFNTLYANTLRGDRFAGKEDYLPFFYPLDGVEHWNRLYGRRGFYQHQCVVPREGDGGPIREILDRIGRSGQASFLAVLKVFGSQPPEGLLSFPRPGVTLALDFPNRGEETLRLMQELDAIVRAAGGTLYPAKDARMDGELYRESMPALNHFTSYIDPAFGSSFQRRVLETP
jgi:FAD/FMN-containing dehydrogenase